MKQSKKALSLLLALIMVFAMVIPAVADEAVPETPEPYTVPSDVSGKVVILHTNDVHGGISGYAKVAALDKAFTDAGANVLVMDAGDFSQGETYVSVSEGATAVELMNMVGYDVATPGNHEFDYGYENLKKLAENAEFPILAANIKFEGKNAFEGHIVLTAGEKKIGVFGLDTPETATKAHPAKIKGITFDGGAELYAVAKAEVEALKAENCDYIVCLSHLGIDDESKANGNRSVDMLAEVEGIDLLIDGHSHSTLETVQAAEGVTDGKVGETVITSTGTKLANIGVAILDGETITVESVAADRITVAEDDPIAARAQAIVDEIETLYGTAFAKSTVALNGERAPGNRTEETNLGDLICDAMLWYATKEELTVPAENVIALTNGGGIRAPIEVGDVSRNDVNKVLPFGNTVAVDYVTGAVLLEALEASTFSTPTAVGGFPQVAGIEFTLDTTKEFDAGENYPDTTYAKPNSINRVTITSINGKDFDPEATYAVVTNDFLAAGGDTYYAFSVSEVITDTGMPLDEALMSYITEELKGEIGEKYAEPQGRITIKLSVADVYSDVDTDSWFKDAVQYVYDNDLMKGTDNGFEPNKELTNAETYQILYNLAGQPKVENVLENVKDEWYADAVSWAVAEELADGVDFTEAAILRGDVVTLMTKYFAKENKSIKGLFLGDENGDLNLDKNLTRAQMATVLSRIPDLKELGTEALTTKVIDLGKYGNATTDITSDTFAAAGFEVGDIIKVEITGVDEPLVFPYGTGYSNVDVGDEIAVINKAGTVDLALRSKDFGSKYGLGTKNEDGTYTITDGKTITISISKKGGYLKQMEVRNIDSKRTNVRDDYSSDEVFANFRAIEMGNIGEGVLYRTSSPVNPELGRNTYADSLIKAAGVKTVINLADNEEAMKGYEGYSETYYSTLNVIPLNMGVDMDADDAKAKLKDAFEFMIANEGPYAFHCTEGKDRAGYFAIVLEALMGGTVEEITADYMLSFENYYHVEKDSEAWELISSSYIAKTLKGIIGVETDEELAKADLAAGTEKYLTETIGLTAKQVTALKDVLSTPVADSLPAAA